MRKEGDRLTYSHIQDFVDVLTAMFDIENRALESRSLTFFADQFDIGQELHFDGHRTIALTGVTASARNVEGEMAGVISAGLGLTSPRKGLADGIVDLDVSHGVGPGCAPDRCLIDQDDVIEELAALDGGKLADLTLPITTLILQT